MVAELDPGNMQVLIVTVAIMLVLSWVPTGDTAKPLIFFCVLHDVLFCPILSFCHAGAPDEFQPLQNVGFISERMFVVLTC